MTTKHIIAAAVLAISTLAGVVSIGKERKPLTPGVMAVTLIINSVVIWLVLS